MESVNPSSQLLRFGVNFRNVLWNSIAQPVSRLCEKYSVYKNKDAAADLNVTQWFLLSFMHAIFTEDLLLCRFLISLSMSFTQLKSTYLRKWLRDDFNFVREDVVRGLEMLNGLVIQESVEIPEVLVTILSGLTEKYNLTNETERDMPDESLAAAVESNDAGRIISAANRGADVDTKIDSGDSLFHLAVDLNCIESITALGYLKANIEALGADLTMPIHRAVMKDNGTAVTALAAAGADFDLKVNGGNTLVHLAAMKSCNNALSSLLQLGADCNENNFKGLSPLSVAVRASNAVAVELLLKRGVDPNKGEFLLHTACTMNNVDIVRNLIKAGAKTDVKNDKGLLPIHVSLDKGIIEEFIITGAAIDGTSNSGDTAIHLAASEGNVDLLKFLICSGANANNVNNNGETALLLASGNNKENVVQLLLEKKSKPNVQDKKGFSAVHNAAKCGSLRILKMLLAVGADPRLKTSEGFNILHVAAQHGHDHIVEYLLESEICDSLTNAICKKGFAAIHKAVEGGSVRILEMLLAVGADLRLKTSEGFNVLHIAALHGRDHIVEYLLESEIYDDLTTTTCKFSSWSCSNNFWQLNGPFNWTALHLSALKGHAAVVRALLASPSSNPDVKDDKGLTPLDLAAFSGNVSVVKELLEHGAKPKCGLSPLHFSALQGNLEILKLLIDNGLSVNVLYNNYYSPLQVACYRGHINVVTFLLDNGAHIKGGYTPYHYAKINNHKAVMDLLISRGSSTKDCC